MANKEKVAVIFVPGIFASHLLAPGRALAWPANSTPKMLTLMQTTPTEKRDTLQRAADFRVGGSLAKNAMTWGSVHLGSYEPFLKDVQNASRKLSFRPVVWAAGYNFMLSNYNSTKYVRRVVEKALESGEVRKFICVTHSMGALVTRSMLNTFPNLAGQCIGVIHVAAPNGGSPEFIMRFYRGVGSPNSHPIRVLFGKTGWRVTTVASSIEGAYELFPFHAQARARAISANSAQPPANDPFFLQAIADFVFSDRNHQPRRTDIEFGRFGRAHRTLPMIKQNIQTYAESAQKFHNLRLGDFILPGKTAAVCLSGIADTVDQVEYVLANQSLVRVKGIPGDGDGTVPLWSQKMFLDRAPDLYGPLTPNGRWVVKSAVTVVPGGIEHSAPLKKGLKQRKVWDAIYEYMNMFHARSSPA